MSRDEALDRELDALVAEADERRPDWGDVLRRAAAAERVPLPRRIRLLGRSRRAQLIALAAGGAAVAAVVLAWPVRDEPGGRVVEPALAAAECPRATLVLGAGALDAARSVAGRRLGGTDARAVAAAEDVHGAVVRRQCGDAVWRGTVVVRRDGRIAYVSRFRDGYRVWHVTG